ncbi:VOC family protein [Neorhizobium lilium]|uniref:Bleomycin resistance protein n=1 Tax=Neorhizobium lilium TaxID=2503024 RepID=A0A3S3VLM0_9HYPH|nr:VOC family protein [Neorhizobium lilium]RWX77213.1 VOC family protein [Neorhizobium lilium]
MASHALVPELSVTDWRRSRDFYCKIIGFDVLYERPEEGFCFLTLGEANLMLDQIGTGRDFDLSSEPLTYPFGRGMNLQILIPAVLPMLARLQAAEVPVYLPLEEKWYRRDDHEVGNRQFVVADPDGYLLRLFEDLGERSLSKASTD